MGCDSSAVVQGLSCNASNSSGITGSPTDTIAELGSLSGQHSDIGYPCGDHLNDKDKIWVQVAQLGGGTCIVDTCLSAKVFDLKVAIQSKLGHSPYIQKLVLAETILVESDAVLGDLGVANAAVLTLILGCEPIGQSSLEKSNGKKSEILASRSNGTSVKECLNEFELSSWETAFEAGKEIWDQGEEWPNLGAWGLDLYWTTRSDGCRYEYWSSAPGDNEYGILVRVDAHTMTAIASGSDDGIIPLEEFEEEMHDNNVFEELVKEGWPRPECWKEESEQESDEEESDEED